MYWWGIFDIIRRLFQTSVIVLVRIVDSRYDTVYAVLVAFVSGMLQVSAKRERMMKLCSTEKGTPAGVVYRAQGPALGSWEDRPPAA